MEDSCTIDGFTIVSAELSNETIVHVIFVRYAFYDVFASTISKNE